MSNSMLRARSHQPPASIRCPSVDTLFSLLVVRTLSFPLNNTEHLPITHQSVRSISPHGHSCSPSSSSSSASFSLASSSLLPLLLPLLFLLALLHQSTLDSPSKPLSPITIGVIMSTSHHFCHPLPRLCTHTHTHSPPKPMCAPGPRVMRMAIAVAKRERGERKLHITAKQSSITWRAYSSLTSS